MKFRTAALLLLILLLAFSAVPMKAQGGKAITVSWLQEPDSLNPMYTTMTFAGYTYQLYLVGAWTLDGNLNPVPLLVEEIPTQENGGISDDGSTFTLKLKEGLVWSDGDPLDSADFVFTFEMLVSDANAPYTTSPWDRMVSVEAPDATTVVVTFPGPYAPWLGLFQWVLPEHVLRPVFEAEGSLDNAEFNRAPSVANGPYVLEEWSAGNFARFIRNENFIGGVANIDTVVVTFVPDDNTYVANLLSGDADVGTWIAPSEVAGLEAAGLGIGLHPSGYNEGWYVNFDPELAHPAMQDRNVRQALAIGWDRATAINDLLAGVLPLSSSFWEGTAYDNPDIGPLEYDPDRAAALLDEAGWVDSDGDGIRDKDGVSLSLRYATTTRQLRRDIQAVAQQQLGELGIELILETYESNIFFNGYAEGGPVSTGNYDIAQWSSSPDAFPDPDTSRFTCAEIPSEEKPSGGNSSFYCNPELDALFAASQSETDLEARAAIYHQIDTIMREDGVWMPLWFDADIWVTNPRIQNATLNGVFPFWDVANWDVAE